MLLSVISPLSITITMSTTSSMLALILSFLTDKTQSNPIAPAPDGERAFVPGPTLGPTNASGPDVQLWAPNTPCNDGTTAEDVVSWVALGNSYASGFVVYHHTKCINSLLFSG